MPPKSVFYKSEIINSSLKIVAKKGFKQLSAREVARELNSSTRPVYEHFESMEELKKAALQKTISLLYDYVIRPHTKNAFLNIGAGYVMFARDHREYFRAIFLEDNDSSGIIDELLKKLDDEMVKVPELRKLTRHERQVLLRRSWIFTHGFATMVFAGYIKNDHDAYIIKMISDTGIVFIEDSIRKHGDGSPVAKGK